MIENLTVYFLGTITGVFLTVTTWLYIKSKENE
jgi:hypothetical protein